MFFLYKRGKLPWFVCPPFEDDLEKQAAEQKKKDEEKEQMVTFSPFFELSKRKQKTQSFCERKIVEIFLRSKFEWLAAFKSMSISKGKR